MYGNVLVYELEFGAKEQQLDLPEHTVRTIFAIFRPWSRGTHEHIFIFKICLKLSVLSKSYSPSAEMF